MDNFMRRFITTALCMGLILFFAAISKNSWERAIALAVIGGFLFGALVAQLWGAFEYFKSKRDSK
ncbi:MAG: hypothetical protein RBR43_07580 [Desulfuromonadaceae bacterium]|nr:hypothetical protein [Desulfuromonas sp.]MDY0185719.1 hypothetical protein [Desulfuromonadaceae bacterium]